MTIDSVEALRRHPPGEKLLLYLDQSTLSALVRDADYQPLRELLKAGVENDRWICLVSLEHVDETLLARPELWDVIDRLADELSMGIQFLARDEIERRELVSAAAEFLGEPPVWEHWEEAFRRDPHTPRDELFDDLFGGS